MTNFTTLKKMLQSYPIATRNRKHLFEFGDVHQRDRAMAQATLNQLEMPQGILLNKDSDLTTGFIMEKGRPPGIDAARTAFRSIQRLFESQAVETRLKPWKVIGFMSDSMDPNGLAACLHGKDETSTHLINVTAGAYFHTLFSAFHLCSDSRFFPKLPNGDEYILAKAQNLFNIELHVPLCKERRLRASRIAKYALYSVFFHELAHVLRGHTIFVLHNGTHSSPISEVHNPKVQSIDVLSRAIETDADDYSGRFFAKAIFGNFLKSEISLQNPKFEEVLFETLVGVTLMYSWFEETDGYHGGSVRAHLVIGSLMSELNINVKESAKWTSHQINFIHDLMAKRSLLSAKATDVREQDLLDLTRETMPLIELRQPEWLKYRPW